MDTATVVHRFGSLINEEAYREPLVIVAQPLLLDPVGKDGGEATDADLEAAAAARRAAAQYSRPPSFQTAAAPYTVQSQGWQQLPAAQLPPGVIDDGARSADAVSLYTLGRITLDHELLASKMIQIESDLEQLPEQVQKSLYVEPISFTQTLFRESMYPKPPGPTHKKERRIKVHLQPRSIRFHNRDSLCMYWYTTHSLHT
jgi:hypothetical protein